MLPAVDSFRVRHALTQMTSDFSLPSPEDVLIDQLDRYEQQFRDAFALDVDMRDSQHVDANERRFFAGFAPAILRTARGLRATPKLVETKDKIGENLHVGPITRLIVEHEEVTRLQLDIDMARERIREVSRLRERTLDLVDVVLQWGPTGRSSLYLRRVASCYMLGLDPECLVMCRAVLDAAFQEKISEELVRRSLPEAEVRRGIDLLARIRAAKTAGVIRPEIADVAHRIRRAGNNVVHDEPARLLEPLDAVRHVVAVLRELGFDDPTEPDEPRGFTRLCVLADAYRQRFGIWPTEFVTDLGTLNEIEDFLGPQLFQALEKRLVATGEEEPVYLMRVLGPGGSSLTYHDLDEFPVDQGARTWILDTSGA